MAEQEGGLFNKIIEKSKRRDSFNREHFNLPTAEMVASQANQLKKDLYANSVKWLLKNLQNCEELKNINNDADRKFIAFVVIATTSYNQTYPLSRTEATELQEMLNKLDLLQKFKLKKAVENVQKMNLGVAALNYGYYEMVQKTPFKK